MHNGDNIVNSNYGFLWNEGDQLEKCIAQLGDNPETRQAWITIFDGKNKDDFAFDTPCTQGIGFSIVNGKLCMNVVMRSNDLWYGFCNDQFCFSMLQQMVAERLNLKVGWYYHFAANMHIYKKHYDVKQKFCNKL
jgi:thymidylate synthase